MSKPSHITHQIFDKNYAANHEIKPILTLRKPICVGFAVLELRKWLIYDFHLKNLTLLKKNLMLNCCLLTQRALLMK